MIKYTTTDIIKRAEQLADLENSDFISDYEKLALLNEHWTMLYQKIIDSGDKSFIKITPVEDGMLLPDDLYEISSIYEARTKDPLTKTSGAENYGYDLVGNQIFLTYAYKNSEVMMEYYPVPQTLFLKEKTVESPYPDNTIAAYKTLYLIKEDENYIVKDLEDDSIDFVLDVKTTPTSFQMYKNAVVLTDDEVGTKEVFNLNSGEAFVMEDGLIQLVNDNILYFFSDETKQVVDLDLNVYLDEYDPLPEDVEKEPRFIYTTPDFMVSYVIYDDCYFVNKESISIPLVKNRLMYSQDGLYAITATNTLIKLNENGIMLAKTDYIPIFFTSETKMMSRKGIGSQRYLEGIVMDSIVDYPNNIYFVLISYLLAIAYCVKQGNDITNLSTQYSNALSQFIGSISRDNNSQYVIKDVYSNRRRW